MSDDGGEVAQLTRLLRTGSEPTWARFRALLAKRRIDAQTSVLAFSAEQSDEAEFTVIATADERAFECAFAADGGSVIEWTEITGRHWATPYGRAVDEALALVRRERPR